MFAAHKRAFSKSTRSKLPIYSKDLTRNTPARRRCTRRRPSVKTLAVAIVVIVLLVLLRDDIYIYNPLRLFGGQRRPPLYEEYRAQEKRLPQHDPKLPPPEGKHAKFLFHRNHEWRTGWGNVVQELLMISALAQATGRTLVFDDYVWRRRTRYAVFNGRIIPSRVPLLALISGPLVGDSPDGKKPRSVSRRYYEEQCSHPTVINTLKIPEVVASGASGMTHLTKWTEKINSMDARCIEFTEKTRSIFDYMLFGNKNVLDVWPAYLSNPAVMNFTYSPLALSAFQNNAHLLFSPQSRPSPVIPMTNPEIITALLPYNIARMKTPPAANDITLPALRFTPAPPLPGLLAVHIRRGDFDAHCRHLLRYSSTFTGFNSFESLPDNWEEPTKEEAPEHYLKRCYPSIEHIVEKVGQVRADHVAAGNPTLRRMYIMTNGKEGWLNELKEALYGAFGRGTSDGWDADGIVSSRDMEWSWEQKFVSQATDMYIGQRADAFIGNGFSSLSGHVVTMRMANGKPPNSTRHW